MSRPAQGHQTRTVELVACAAHLQAHRCPWWSGSQVPEQEGAGGGGGGGGGFDKSDKKNVSLHSSFHHARVMHRPT